MTTDTYIAACEALDLNIAEIVADLDYVYDEIIYYAGGPMEHATHLAVATAKLHKLAIALGHEVEK